MNGRSTLLAAMVLVGVGLLAAAPAGADVVPEQRFGADSGDACPMGTTAGLLRWGSESVGVSGAVLDRPLPSEPDTRCGEDGRYTVATFTAYAGRTPVATSAGRADNGRSPIAFVLGSSRTVDRVVIVVCRPTSPVGPVDSCGRPVEYSRP